MKVKTSKVKTTGWGCHVGKRGGGTLNPYMCLKRGREGGIRNQSSTKLLLERCRTFETTGMVLEPTTSFAKTTI